MEKLTLQLLLDAGHEPVLWVQSKLTGIPQGVIVETLPKDTLAPVGFAGDPLHHLPNGGIGSLAHWSDYFAFKTLHEHGGIWVQMDAAVTKPIVAEDYTFTPWLSMISPVVMSLPKGSEYSASMKQIIEHMLVDGMAGRNWHEAMVAMSRQLVFQGIEARTFSDYYDCGGVDGSPYTHPAAQSYDIIHWSNATHNTSKEKPTKGSEYERLCKSVKLI
jgi:hypothetical protein